MARFYSIHITGTGAGGSVSIYLTDDRSSAGRPCKLTVANVATLLTPESGNTTTGADGTPFTEKPLTAGKGRPFEINIAWMLAADFAALKALIDYIGSHSTAVRVAGVGVPGNFDVDGAANFAPIPLDFEGFTTDAVKGIKIRLITSGVH